MKNNRMKDALENIARGGVPENINLWPRIESRLHKRNSFMQTLRARPVILVLVVILTLMLLSGVAYAIGKVTGYIPGIGLVDQSAPLRVLTEPVTITRDGITVTVEDVVLSIDKTVLTYKVEGIPSDAYPGDEAADGLPSYSFSSAEVIEGTPEVTYSNTENNNYCYSDISLLLPDGFIVIPRSLQGGGWMTGFEHRIVYAPIQANVTGATLRISCIEGTVPGKLPENWEIPLRFTPVSPDMTILPVSGVTPSADAISLENVIETDGGYILIGKFRSIDLPMNAKALGISDWMKITDVNGQAIEAFPPNDLDLTSEVYGEFYWAYEIKGKNLAWPLTITLEAVS